jgi:hypothetical protein
MLIEEIACDELNKHSQQSQLRHLSGGQRRGPWDLNGTPMAPPWRRDRSLEKAAKNERGHFRLRATSEWNMRQATPVDSP